MIFGLIKLVVWFLGVATLAYIALPYFGYEVNWNYWNESKATCEERLRSCQRDLIKSGLEGAKEKCDFKCVDTKSLIQKKAKSPVNALSSPTDDSSQ